eukprot:4422802-Amphidinium_carterae.1
MPTREQTQLEDALRGKNTPTTLLKPARTESTTTTRQRQLSHNAQQEDRHLLREEDSTKIIQQATSSSTLLMPTTELHRKYANSTTDSRSTTLRTD